MAAQETRTVWLPKDSLFSFPIMALVWAMGGVVRGILMWLTGGGNVLIWLINGQMFGVMCSVIFGIYSVFAYRELSIRMPLIDPATAPERIGKAVKSFRYRSIQKSPTSIVCQPNSGLFRIFKMQFLNLHIHLNGDTVELTGPAVVVNRVKKKLRVK